ncbi:hypothetical protein FB451DRAFT_1552406 [Mycena latifolia]|nr:hypothetical protein FB451DRAFT_1552406 [Mycena latifolia]
MPFPAQQPAAPELAPRKTQYRGDGVPVQRAEEEAERKYRRETSRKTLERENRDLKEENQRLKVRLAEMKYQQGAHLEAYPILEASAAVGHGIIPGPVFGLAADLTSTVDVGRMMEDLNEEVFQTAAALSDFDFRAQTTKMHGTGRQGFDSELRSRMALILGSEFVALLSVNKGSHPVPEILVQIALQTVMSAWSYRKIHSWVVDKTEEPNTCFADLYADIRRSEDPKDAARWRGMTRKHLVQRASSSYLVNSLLSAVVDVLFLARPDAKEGLNRKTIEEEPGNRLAGVVRLVLNLNRAIGAHVVSEELESVFVERGAKFEPKTMEKMWSDDDARSSRESVVCTTGLGLRKKGQNASAHRDGMTVVKPSVLLHSTLPELMA